MLDIAPSEVTAKDIANFAKGARRSLLAFHEAENKEVPVKNLQRDMRVLYDGMVNYLAASRKTEHGFSFDKGIKKSTTIIGKEVDLYLPQEDPPNQKIAINRLAFMQTLKSYVSTPIHELDKDKIADELSGHTGEQKITANKAINLVNHMHNVMTRLSNGIEDDKSLFTNGKLDSIEISHSQAYVLSRATGELRLDQKDIDAKNRSIQKWREGLSNNFSGPADGHSVRESTIHERSNGSAHNHESLGIANQTRLTILGNRKTNHISSASSESVFVDDTGITRVAKRAHSPDGSNLDIDSTSNKRARYGWPAPEDHLPTNAPRPQLDLRQVYRGR